MSLSERRHSIETIRVVYRTTMAMRVLAMSLHARLKKSAFLSDQFYQLLEGNIEKNFQFEHDFETNQKQLYIFVGSEKGLCGSHNNDLATIARKYLEKEGAYHIIIGKKLHHLIKDKCKNALVISGIQEKTIDYTTQTILGFAKTNECMTINIISTFARTLFDRKIRLTTCTARSKLKKISNNILILPEEKSLNSDKLYSFLLTNKIKNVLIQAMMAEQAARFVAMDNACTNAQKSLHEKTLAYNRIRQTLITNELQDIVSGWMNQNT